MKIVRNVAHRELVAVRTHDSAHRRTRTRDEVHAQPTSKVLVLGRVWEGDLKPRIDALEEALKPLAGFTLGHTVEAEPAPATLWRIAA